MWQDQTKAISQYYQHLIAKFGYRPEACDYGRPESQKIKFHVLAQAISLNHKTILDVGCGFADFADYLEKQYSNFMYSGIDITSKMIEQAKKNRPDLDLHVVDIMQEPIAGQYDFVTANGIFYLLQEQPLKYMQHLIEIMFKTCKEAVAFNSLSSWAAQQEPNEFYADPLATLAFCRTLTPWVVLRHDYLPHDFTIYMYKTQQNQT